MKKLLVLVSMLSMLAGCEYVKKLFPAFNTCATATSVAANVSQALATTLNCSDPTAISATLQNALVPLKLCESKPQGFASIDLCPQIAQVVTGLTVTSLPAIWGCKGGVAADTLTQIVTSHCEDAIVNHQSSTP